MERQDCRPVRDGRGLTVQGPEWGRAGPPGSRGSIQRGSQRTDSLIGTGSRIFHRNEITASVWKAAEQSLRRTWSCPCTGPICKHTLKQLFCTKTSLPNLQHLLLFFYIESVIMHHKQTLKELWGYSTTRKWETWELLSSALTKGHT